MTLVTLDDLRELAELCMRSDAKALSALEAFPAAATEYLRQQHEVLEHGEDWKERYRQKWREVSKMIDEILAAHSSDKQHLERWETNVTL